MATAITIEALGISQDEVVERVVARLTENLMNAYGVDDDGERVEVGNSKFLAHLQKKVLEKVDVAVAEIAGRNVLPNVAAYVENICLQETTKWGEKVGKSVTFTEYLVSRAERYLTEEVNYEGKSKDEMRDSYGWSKSQTRVAHLVHKHLHYSIETAMKEALKGVNASVAKGLEDAVKIKLGEVLAKLKVGVTV